MFGKKLIAIGTISIFLLLSIASTIPVTAISSGKTIRSFSPSDDAFVDATHPDYCAGSESRLLVRNMYGYGGSSYWGWDTLIKFDSLTTGLRRMPAYAVISAKLNLFYYRTWDSSPAGRSLNLHRVLSAWNENIVTKRTEPKYDQAISASSIVPNGPGAWMSFDVTQDVQKIISRVYPNYGWKISDDNYWGNCDIPIVCFYSKEFGSLMPNLEVTYLMPLISDGNNSIVAV